MQTATTNEVLFFYRLHTNHSFGVLLGVF